MGAAGTIDPPFTKSRCARRAGTLRSADPGQERYILAGPGLIEARPLFCALCTLWLSSPAAGVTFLRLAPCGSCSRRRYNPAPYSPRDSETLVYGVRSLVRPVVSFAVANAPDMRDVNL